MKGGRRMDFEQCLAQCKRDVERYVIFRLSSRQDAEDVCQDVFFTAYQKFDALRDPAHFKSWLLAIARNKCHDHLRKRMRHVEISMDVLPDVGFTVSRMGPVATPVSDAMDNLTDVDARMLDLYYARELSQQEIAQLLHIPLGTVKSRLHYARKAFESAYSRKGENLMTQKLPEYMPPYTIEKMAEKPFPVRWEELMGWTIVPKLGEKLSWGLYEMPSRKRTEYTDMEVTGKAQVHGIEGVEIKAVQYNTEDYYRTGSVDQMERTFVAQLTDTHSRYLSETHVENGVRMLYTFLDGAAFMNNWGFGEDNCGNEVNVAPKGLLRREGNVITGQVPQEVLDVVGRYKVTLGGKTYDTICVMDVNCFNDAVASEQYLDQNGRTVLWRRFNRNDWAFHRYQKKWDEMLPQNEKLIINGQTYVHWYDFMSDYVL